MVYPPCEIVAKSILLAPSFGGCMLTRAMTTFAAALIGLLAGSSISQASTITFSGSGTSGTISTPPGSIPWAYPGSDAGVFAWGTPGLFDGIATWGGANSESEFTITFTGLPAGVTITPIDLTVGGSTPTTRFDDVTQSIDWNGTISPDGHTVDFVAPAGSPLKPGDGFFINVAFSASAGSSVSFSGAFDPQASAVPLPSAFNIGAASMLVGLGCLSLSNRRKATRAT
jgi:hypothetical protein